MTLWAGSWQIALAFLNSIVVNFYSELLTCPDDGGNFPWHRLNRRLSFSIKICRLKRGIIIFRKQFFRSRTRDETRLWINALGNSGMTSGKVNKKCNFISLSPKKCPSSNPDNVRDTRIFPAQKSQSHVDERSADFVCRRWGLEFWKWFRIEINAAEIRKRPTLKIRRIFLFRKTTRPALQFDEFLSSYSKPSKCEIFPSSKPKALDDSVKAF